ncbi:putative diaminopimelate epimerase [Magnetofaba australis IT-1]|uniref:Diaminopimelate epimerase n=2 Tax=Magnetofaba TaxID=1472292 RepID=A0A1Y2K7I0_9PROT|nr:putative diaminopimelate epimerase [Magnetofaba australis IT-1]
MELRIDTLAGVIAPRFLDNGMIAVDMGPPIFAGRAIPTTSDEEVLDHVISTTNGQHVISAVSMGNPHAVLFTPDADTFPILTVGPSIEHHELFPNRTNVEAVQVFNRDHIRMRVWERGAGLTPACGTGACAAAVAAMRLGYVERSVNVTLDGGDLHIAWRESDGHVIMTGPAEESFRGEMDIDDL